MKPYIVFDGVSSEDMGVIVEQLPTWHRAQRRISETGIPGRSGAVVQDEGGYDLYTATLRLNVNGADIREVYGWLRGEGWMISSDEPEYRAYVYAYNSVTNERFRMTSTRGGSFDSLSINLRVEPYLRLVDEPLIQAVEGEWFRGQGHDSSLPLIRVTGSGTGTLNVNDVPVRLTGLDGDLFIDCEAGIAYVIDQYDTMQWAGSQVALSEMEWPTLNPDGFHNVVEWDGGITAVTLQPNWRFL